MRERRCRLVACLLAVLAGCSGAGGKSASEPGAGKAGEATPAASGPLSEAECMRLLDHYLDLALAEKRATLPPEQVPTEEQVERIRVEMRDDAKQACVGLTERARYDCAMKARTTRALGACLTEQPTEQPTGPSQSG
jgi:hypothetical protein